MASRPSECRRIIYHGRVQGVGFRATVATIARRHPVAGYVRNMADGTVELVVEAAAADLSRFLTEINATMSGYISTASTEMYPLPERFRGFSVKP